jgi:hypothetical protein
MVLETIQDAEAKPVPIEWQEPLEVVAGAGDAEGARA